MLAFMHVMATENTTATSTADSPECPDPCLSGSAGVGIGIGVSACAVGLVSLMWVMLRERRKRRALQRQLAQPYELQDRPGTELVS